MSPAPYDEAAVLADLPAPLRAVLFRRIGAHHGARALPALRRFGPECAGFLLTRLRPALFARGDTLYGPGDAAEEMYFVVRGAVRPQPARSLTSLFHTASRRPSLVLPSLLSLPLFVPFFLPPSFSPSFPSFLSCSHSLSLSPSRSLSLPLPLSLSIVLFLSRSLSLSFYLVLVISLSVFPFTPPARYLSYPLTPFPSLLSFRRCFAYYACTVIHRHAYILDIQP
jgi:hypothetical protein